MSSRRILLALGVLVLGCGLLVSNSAQLFAASSQPGPRNPVAPAAVLTPQAQTAGVQGPIVGKSVSAAAFDGDVRSLPQVNESSVSREQRPLLRRTIPRTPQTPLTVIDPVRQTTMGQNKMPSPLQSFSGMSYNGNCGGAFCGTGYPPDPNGDVGPNHYIEAVNTSIAIFDKTGTQLAAFRYNALFASAFAPCNAGNRGDPIALYDAIADRWIVADFGWADGTVTTGPYYECIAVSKTSDPVSGGWWLYTFEANGSYMNDYPKWGVWSDGLYMSANLYKIYSSGFGDPVGVQVWAFNRDDLISGAPSGLRNVSFTLSNSYANVLPSNMRGAAPPTGTPAFFASVDQPNTFHLWKFHVDPTWTMDSSQNTSTFTGPTNLTVASFAMPCNAALTVSCVPQPDSTEQVDALGDRLMMQLQYRNFNGTETLWVNHTVANGSATGYPTGIRWYQICQPNGSPFIKQQSTFQPDSNYRWMGSLAVDKQGNMALGYSISSASMYPSIRYAGRLGSDSANTLAQGEASLIEGSGSQNGGGSRWGDYSAMTIDPTDDLTFWYVNQYYSTTGGDWQTRIGSFKLAPTPVTPVLGAYRYYFPFISKGSMCD